MNNEITDNMIEVGENYAKEMSGNSTARMDGEVWTLQSSDTAISYGVVKAAFGELVPSGEERSKTCSWSITAGTTVRGYKLSATVSGSLSIKKVVLQIQQN